MGRKKLVILFIYLFILNSCCPIIKGWYNTNEGANRPKKNNFKLGKVTYKLKSNDIIDTNCIYQYNSMVEHMNPISKEKKSYQSILFLRFFPNGRYIESGVLEDKEAIYYYNNLNRGNIGYYKIIGNKVFLEYYVVGPQDCGKYLQYELEIKQDSIGNYRKIDVNGLIGTPDW